MARRGSALHLPRRAGGALWDEVAMPKNSAGPKRLLARRATFDAVLGLDAGPYERRRSGVWVRVSCKPRDGAETRLLAGVPCRPLYRLPDLLARRGLPWCILSRGRRIAKRSAGSAW
ncbi:MAG: hypothetical protein HC897_12150 [Thermoanaerobaculia bacterium]|nr:hypothetical protein [Thermoanaerobaculia bacterium]